MEFRKEDSALLLLYMPDLAGNDVRKKLDQDNLHLKHTFHLCRKNEYVPKTAEPYEYEFCLIEMFLVQTIISISQPRLTLNLIILWPIRIVLFFPKLID